MAYITVEDGVPGIRSLFNFRPETGAPLCDLAQALLRGPSPLSAAERELIATHVSNRNHCVFCMNSHAAAARCLYGDEKELVDDLVYQNSDQHLSPKMKALLIIADKVRENGNRVSSEDMENARTAGANDTDIHDTVLITAAFSMFNRYVDGLASLTSSNESDYVDMGKRMSERGYHI